MDSFFLKDAQNFAVDIEKTLGIPENPNDRIIIVLLKLKRRKTKRDVRRLTKLCKSYPDNEAYEQKILKHLESRKMTDRVTKEPDVDEYGYLKINPPVYPDGYYTTIIGENALKNNLFPSEFRQKRVNKRFRSLQAIGIAIAAIGGLITVFTFIHKLIQCCR